MSQERFLYPIPVTANLPVRQNRPNPSAPGWILILGWAFLILAGAPSRAATEWTGAERQTFYHLAEGSEVIPLELLRPLKSATTKAGFLEDPERFGLIRDPDPLNADGLPVGLTAAPSQDSRNPAGLKMIGVNCAACHVGEISFRGQTVRLDGAPGRFDVESFNRDLAESIKATVENAVEFNEYLNRLLIGPSPTLLKPGSLSVLRSLAAVPAAAGLDWSRDELLLDLLQLARQRVMRGPTNEEPAGLYRDFRRRSGSAAAADVSRNPGPAVDPARIDALLKKHNQPGRILDTLKFPDPAASLVAAIDGIQTVWGALRMRLGFFRRIAAGQPPGIPALNGRTDAFGHARNFIFPGSARSPDAPVDYPPLWGFVEFAWLHYDGNTTSVLERNTGQAIGLGALFNPTTFESSVALANTHELEQLARRIPVPAWPSAMLGEPDAARVALGHSLFKTHCAQCHLDRQPAGGEFPAYTPADVGTDPARAANFALLLADGRGYPAALQQVLERLKTTAAGSEGVLARLPEWELGRTSEWRAPDRYTARPLRGIWATAPYLHNGSVPTLYDLLSRNRPARFRVGQREYDPARMGYATPAPGAARTQEFDTGLAGNGNRGHYYGADLPEVERGHLLEYLKTR